MSESQGATTGYALSVPKDLFDDKTAADQVKLPEPVLTKTCDTISMG